MYRKGEGTEKNDVIALKWLEKAAEQGNADAQLRCGIMYLGD
jgi:TPR repeat protein